jgi:hypothetical protein
MKQIGYSIDVATKKICEKKGFVYIKIIADWENIVGEEYALYSKPIKIDHYQNKATLQIEVYNSAMLMKMQYAESQLLERIRLYFGRKAIDKLKFMSKPMMVKKPEIIEEEVVKLSKKQAAELNNQVAEVADDALAASLRALGKFVMNEK